MLTFAVLILLAAGPQAEPTGATDDAVFATPKDPHGVAAGFDETGTRPRIYVTPCRNPRRIVYIESDGRERRFHTLPNRSDCVGDDIAVAPGGKLDAFGENFVYVTQGSVIYKITPNGRTRTTFVPTLSDPNVAGDNCTDPTSYITFDDIGTPEDANSFQNDMIAVCSGRIWRIKPNGAVTFVYDVGTPIQGPVVAPESFTAGPGRLLVVATLTGTIYAVPPSGGATFVVTWLGAKDLHVVPALICGLGPASQQEGDRAAFFLARTTANELRRLKKSTVENFGGTVPAGRVLVTNNGTSPANAQLIGILSSAAPVTVATFHALNFIQDGGSAEFCPRLRVSIFIKPGTYRKYEPESNGKIPVIIFGTESFDVTEIQESSLRFGETGTEASFSHCDGSLQDVNGDGYLDKKCHFNFSATGLDPSDTQAWITGFINPPFEGND